MDKAASPRSVWSTVWWEIWWNFYSSFELCFDLIPALFCIFHEQEPCLSLLFFILLVLFFYFSLAFYPVFFLPPIFQNAYHRPPSFHNLYHLLKEFSLKIWYYQSVCCQWSNLGRGQGRREPLWNCETANDASLSSTLDKKYYMISCDVPEYLGQKRAYFIFQNHYLWFFLWLHYCLCFFSLCNTSYHNKWMIFPQTFFQITHQSW